MKKHCGQTRLNNISGQPLKDDVGKCVEAALKKYDEQKNVVWISLRWSSAPSPQNYDFNHHHHHHCYDHDKSTISIRQEPCIYVNGKPYNVRATDEMANHLVMTEVLFSKHRKI